MIIFFPDILSFRLQLTLTMIKTLVTVEHAHKVSTSTDKPVLPLRPRHHSSQLIEGDDDDDHTLDSDSNLRPPVNDSKPRIHSSPASATKVRLFSRRFPSRWAALICERKKLGLLKGFKTVIVNLTKIND